MNLELLTKLVKLANNNPNENEANAAARKVCQLIEAGGFKFGNSPPKESIDDITRKWNSGEYYKRQREDTDREYRRYSETIWEWYNRTKT